MDRIRAYVGPRTTPVTLSYRNSPGYRHCRLTLPVCRALYTQRSIVRKMVELDVNSQMVEELKLDVMSLRITIDTFSQILDRRSEFEQLTTNLDAALALSADAAAQLDAVRAMLDRNSPPGFPRLQYDIVRLNQEKPYSMPVKLFPGSAFLAKPNAEPAHYCTEPRVGRHPELKFGGIIEISRAQEALNDKTGMQLPFRHPGMGERELLLGLFWRASADPYDFTAGSQPIQANFHISKGGIMRVIAFGMDPEPGKESWQILLNDFWCHHYSY